MYETIKTEVDRGILCITLHRPERMNAYTHQMSDELLRCFQAANQDDEVRVVIVTGSGSAFCAGMDLQDGEQTFSTEETVETFRDIGGKVSLQLFEMKKPVIAAINGPAVGIGITMTLPMDIRIVKKGTKLGFVFGRRGIGPEAASGWFLPRLVGVGKAQEWMLTGRYVSTEEALAAGLVQYEVENPLEKAMEMANDIIMHTAATSNCFTRQLLWKMLGEAHPYASHRYESAFLHWASQQADVKEGIDSFLEKRAPVFPLPASALPDIFLQRTGGNEG